MQSTPGIIRILIIIFFNIEDPVCAGVAGSADADTQSMQLGIAFIFPPAVKQCTGERSSVKLYTKVTENGKKNPKIFISTKRNKELTAFFLIRGILAWVKTSQCGSVVQSGKDGCIHPVGLFEKLSPM